MSVVLWWYHLKGGATPPPAPKRPVLGGALAKKKKPHSEFIREAAEALLAMEPGTPQYRAARTKLKAALKAERAKAEAAAGDEEVLVMLFFLDLL